MLWWGFELWGGEPVGMMIECLNPRCDQRLVGRKASIGRWVSCPKCNHRFIWAEKYYSGTDFVIYDLETTGLYPDSDEFIQVAAVRFSGGRVDPEKSFFSYARPRQRISAFISEYTGITNEDVRHAPRADEVLEAFSVFVGGATLIAHNGKRFDGRFLEATCQRHRMSVRRVDGIDSIHISKRLFGAKRGIRHSQDEVLNRLNISADGVRRHDARGDVHLLGLAVQEMWHRLELDSNMNGIERHETLLPHV